MRPNLEGSPRGTEKLPGPGKKVKPPLRHRSIPRPYDHLLSLDKREVRPCRDSEVIGDEGEGEKGRGAGRVAARRVA